MNFKRIEAFFWVARFRSFSKAARQQCTTQPAISSRIAALETELGVRLFERDGNTRVMLTAKGHELLPYAEKLVSFSKEFVNIANNSSAYSGVLRLGVSETIAHSWLSIFLKQFKEISPDATIELTVDVSTALTQLMLDGSCDIAFLVGPLRNPEIRDHYLTTVPLVWVANPALGLGLDEIPLAALSKWPIITYPRNTIPYNEIKQAFAQSSDQPAQVFASSSLAACRRLVVDGVGVSALPRVLVQADLDAGLLESIDTRWHPSDLSFTVSHPMSPHRPELLPLIELAKTVALAFEENGHA